MSEVVYRNLGELVNEAKKKYGFNQKGRRNYPIDHKKSNVSSTGFLHVSKIKSFSYSQGFCYRYVYYDDDDKRHTFSSVDIVKLRKRVADNGLEWEIVDKQKALDLANSHNININNLM